MSFEGGSGVRKRSHEAENVDSVEAIRAKLSALEARAQKGEKGIDPLVLQLEDQLRTAENKVANAKRQEESQAKIATLRSEITALEKRAAHDKKAEKALLAKEDELRAVEQSLQPASLTKTEVKKVDEVLAEAALEPKKPESKVKQGKRVFEVGVVDTSELVRAQARDRGDRQMTESAEDRSGGFLRRTVRRIWKHNLAQEYYRQKEIKKAQSEIEETKNLYAGEEALAGAHQQAMDAVVSRFTSEFSEEMLRDEEQSSRQLVENSPTNQKLKQLISEFAGNPNMSEAAFAEERNRILSALNPDLAERGINQADNLLAIASEVRKAVEHGERLEDMDFDVRLTLGKARESLNTEAKMHTFDRVVEKMQNSKIGKFVVNEPAMLALGAAAYSTLKATSFNLLRSHAAKALTLGGSALAAGGIAAAKESARLERERAQHMRESAKGMRFEEGAKRREQFNESTYDAADAQVLTTQLEQSLAALSSDALTPMQVTEMLSHLSEVESRIRVGDQEKADFISYSRFDQVEQERASLDLARAKLKVALGKNDEAKRQMKGNVNEFLDRSVRAGLLLNEELTEKDRVFKKMKHKKVAAAAIKTALIGAGAGLVFQEAASLLDSSQDGLIEGVIDQVRGKSGATHATTLESLHRYIAGNGPRLPLGKAHEELIGHTRVTLPENASLLHNHDGTFTLLRDGQPVAEHVPLSFAANGDLTDAAHEALQSHNVHAAFSLAKGSSETHFSGTAAEFIKHHAEGTTRVHRELWYDNDTSHPFDKNELRGWWGGSHNTGVNAKGDYVFTMQHMTSNGSYHDGVSTDAQELMRSGKMKMLFSLSKDTQHTVYEVPVDAHGTAIIAKDSELAKLMFTHDHGHSVFTGKYAEVAQSMGHAKDGAENTRILATLVGKGKEHLATDIKTITNVPSVRLDVPDDWTFDMPPFIPVPRARQPLEDGKNGAYRPRPQEALKNSVANGPVAFGYYFGGQPSPVQREIYKQRFSPSLRENPNAQLEPAFEINNYLRKENPLYNIRLQEFARLMEPMEDSCTLSVCIPVAGHQEEKNIERTLSNYLTQTADPKSYEVVLFVNRPETDQAGKPLSSDGTLAEIAKFKQSHPELRIRLMETVLPANELTMGTVRKMMTDTVLLRSQQRENPKDINIVSNDADTKGLSTEYIANYEKRFANESNIDAFMGQLDWDPEAYIRNPLVHVGTRLFQYIDMQNRKAGVGIASSGANFAFRGSTYAAVGGYSPTANLAEDVDFGRRVRAAREGSTDYTAIAFGGARTSRLYTSARRAEKAVRDGLAPVEQWDQGFSAFDDEVRKTDWSQLAENPDYNNPETVASITKALEDVINRTLNVTQTWQNKDRFFQNMRRSLGYLGVKYQQEGDAAIRITDASKLIQGLAEYQKEGMELMAHKTGQQT